MGRRIVDNIQEFTSKLILSERLFEAYSLIKTFKITNSRTSSQRCCRRCAHSTCNAQQLSKNQKIQNSTFSFQRQALPVERYLYPKYILHVLRERSFESVIVHCQRYKMIKKREQRIVFFFANNQSFSKRIYRSTTNQQEKRRGNATCRFAYVRELLSSSLM